MIVIYHIIVGQVRPNVYRRTNDLRLACIQLLECIV